MPPRTFSETSVNETLSRQDARATQPPAKVPSRPPTVPEKKVTLNPVHPITQPSSSRPVSSDYFKMTRSMSNASLKRDEPKSGKEGVSMGFVPCVNGETPLDLDLVGFLPVSFFLLLSVIREKRRRKLMGCI